MSFRFSISSPWSRASWVIPSQATSFLERVASGRFGSVNDRSVVARAVASGSTTWTFHTGLSRTWSRSSESERNQTSRLQNVERLQNW